MPKKEEILESKMCSNIDPDWTALKLEYDEATRYEEKNRKSILQKEKDDFAKMWCAAGLELKETLEKKSIIKPIKKN